MMILHYHTRLTFAIISKINDQYGQLFFENSDNTKLISQYQNNFGLENDSWFSNFPQYIKAKTLSKIQYNLEQIPEKCSVVVCTQPLVTPKYHTYSCISVGFYAKLSDYILPTTTLDFGKQKLTFGFMEFIKQFTTLTFRICGLGLQLSNGQIISGQTYYLNLKKDFFINFLWRFLDEPKRYLMLARYMRQYARFGRLLILDDPEEDKEHLIRTRYWLYQKRKLVTN